MKTNAICMSALAALATASPAVMRRQDIDMTVVEAAAPVISAVVPIGAVAETVTYDMASATAAATASPLPVAASQDTTSNNKRAACAAQPLGSGPVPSPDTDAAFLASSDFSAAALNAATPAGYARTFANLQASSSAYGYLGLTTLATYDTAKCAAKCTATKGCLGFNIYFERDPVVDPAAACANPASTTVIKCVFWGGLVEAANANNAGQWRGPSDAAGKAFHVVIAGSNGYMSTTVPTVAGYTGVGLGNATTNAPADCNGANTFMGSKMFTTSVTDPALCAAACASQNAYNTANPPAAPATPMLCQAFATYLLAKNGASQGQYCAMYTQSWDSSYATNFGQYRGKDLYTVGLSYFYTNTTNPGTPVCVVR